MLITLTFVYFHSIYSSLSLVTAVQFLNGSEKKHKLFVPVQNGDICSHIFTYLYFVYTGFLYRYKNLMFFFQAKPIKCLLNSSCSVPTTVHASVAPLVPPPPSVCAGTTNCFHHIYMINLCVFSPLSKPENA